ncbi:MAG: iron-containing alcohol dehydrogenase [Thermoanaerobaculia bacterium]
MSHSAATPDSDAWAVDLGGIHVVFGEGTLAALGEAARGLGARRVLLVTDPGLEEAGHVQRAQELLRRAGVEVGVFDGVVENPDTRTVAAGVEAAGDFRPDLLVGLGGGSSMDCAKGINFLHTNGGRMEDYWGDGKAARPMLPSIGVPTTAGTGSEGQRFALISSADSHRKMACGDKQARFKTVILDPELISSMPRKVAAVTGIDAVSHAVESFVTRRRNPISQLFAREAWRLLESSLERFLADPEDREARSKMLLGAHLGGAAIEASMLGAAHSCANPLTAHFDVTHGIAVGLMLPHVIRFNAASVGELYGDLARAAGLNGQQPASEALSARVAEICRAAGLPAGLEECGVDGSQLELLAAEAADQWTAQFNPRTVASDDLRQLYESAL